MQQHVHQILNAAQHRITAVFFGRHNPIIQNTFYAVAPVFIFFYPADKIIADFVGADDQTMAQIKALPPELAQDNTDCRALQQHQQHVGNKKDCQLTAGEIHNFKEEKGYHQAG